MKNTALISAFLFVATAVYARSPINLDALRRDGYGVVIMKHPLENELIVRATINGRPVDLILDTGWSGPGNGLCLDQDLASGLHVATQAASGPNHTWTGRKMSVAQGMAKSTIMGNAQFTDVPLYFSNFVGLRDSDKIMGTGHLNPVLRVGVRGLITNGFLRATSAIIDLPNLELYVRPPGTGRRAMLGSALRESGMSEVPLSRAGQHFVVDVEVNGVAGKMFIDTGADLTMLDRKFAERAKASLNMRATSSDAAGVKKDAWLAGVHSFKIGGAPVYVSGVTVADSVLGSGDFAGLIGMDILGENWGIIDCGSEKLYLSHVR
jgi:predicted aspartyl protease